MNGKSLVVVLLVAGLAVAGWFGWRAAVETPPQPAPSATAKAEAQVGSAALADQADMTPDAAAKSSVVDVDRTEAAPSEVPAAGAKDAIIRGRLVDEAGSPRRDTLLRRSTWRNPDGADFFGGGNLPNNPQHDSTTRADGSFEFALASDHSASLELPDLELVFDKSMQVVHGHKGDQDLGALVVRRGGVVSGIVQDERGTPVAGVTVAANVGTFGFGSERSATTGEDGKFRVGKLRPGVWMLRTASAQFLPTTKEVTIGADPLHEDIVLVVAPGRAIVGQVVDDLGRAVEGFKVVAKRAEAHGAIDIERFAADEATTTDGNGYFTLAGLAGETATVRAFGSGHSPALAPDVKVGTGNLLLQVDRLASIAGVLIGVDGQPLVGSMVRAVPATQAGVLGAHGIEGVLQDRAASATTAEDGTFRIEDVRPGLVTVDAEGKTHRPARQAGLQVAPAQSLSGVRLIADRGAVARVSVVDELGKPVSAAKVTAERPPAPDAGEGGMRVRGRRVEATSGDVRVMGDEQILGNAITDADGLAVIAGLEGGSVAFRAEHERFAAAKTVTLPLLRNGTAEVTLTVRTPGFAEVRITEVDGSAAQRSSFRITGPLGSEGGGRNGMTDAAGKAVVGPLAAGRYEISLVRKAGGTRIGSAVFVMSDEEGAAIGGTEKRFVVVAGETTVVEIRRPVLTRLFGTVTGVEGPVADCTVEIEKSNGDEMVMPGMGSGRTVTTAADGTFAIEDVEQGNYVLRYGLAAQVVKAELPLVVPAEQPELRQDLMLRTGKIRVQAWSEVMNGPLANADVEVRLAKAESAGAPPVREMRMMMVTISSNGNDNDDTTMMTVGAPRVRTDATGWAEIEGVPAGRYDLKITHKTCMPLEHKDVTVLELQTTDVGRVQLAQAGRVRGKVLAADGSVPGMAFVSYRLVDGEWTDRPSPAMRGSFTLDELPPGRYQLRAREMPMTPGSGPGAYGPEVDVEVKAGETATADLRLPGQ